MYKIAVAARILSGLASSCVNSQSEHPFGRMTVDVDIAAHACLYASRAAAPEPCGPRGTATKRSSASRGRASPASSTPSPPPHTKKREIHALKGEVASRDEPTSRFAFQKMQAAGFHPTQISQAPFKLQSSASWRPVPRPPRAELRYRP